jgi:hypothetical protein
MIAAQLIAAHNATMECYRRAMIDEQTLEGRRDNLSLAVDGRKERREGQQEAAWCCLPPIRRSPLHRFQRRAFHRESHEGDRDEVARRQVKLFERHVLPCATGLGDWGSRVQISALRPDKSDT